MDWEAVVERQRARYEEVELPVLLGNAAYGAGLALLMLGRDAEAREWLDRAAARWRESWPDATPTSWGRPIGVMKALLLAGDDPGAAEAAEWALTLGCEEAESPIGRYAAALALLVLGRDPDARHPAISIQEREDFPAGGRGRACLHRGPRPCGVHGSGGGRTRLVRAARRLSGRRSP